MGAAAKRGPTTGLARWLSITFSTNFATPSRPPSRSKQGWWGHLAPSSSVVCDEAGAQAAARTLSLRDGTVRLMAHPKFAQELESRKIETPLGRFR